MWPRAATSAVGPDGAITDRRAGRISTDVCRTRGQAANNPAGEVELFLEPVRDYRFVLVLRGDGLGAEVDDTDPGRTGEPPIASRTGMPDPSARRRCCGNSSNGPPFSKTTILPT